MFHAAELYGQNARLFRTEPCRSSTLILACASVANPVRSHGLPPRRTSCSAPPSSRCAALSVYFNTNLGSTLECGGVVPAARCEFGRHNEPLGIHPDVQLPPIPAFL